MFDALREKLLAQRDRLLSDPKMLRRAGDFAATRLVARHEARAMFDLAAGFVYAQTLAACEELGLFDRLAAGPGTAFALAQGTPLSPDALHRLLVAAEPLLLVERRSGGRWGLGRRGAAVLGNPGFRAMIAHHALFYRELADPVALLARGRGTEMPAFWPYATEQKEGEVAPYSALMAASQAFVAGEVIAAYRFGRHRRLVDVGGGDGTFVAAALARWPHLEATVFDLPQVAHLAAARLAGEPRARAVGGDVFADALPSGDVATLVRVLHDHDDRAAAAILRAIHTALEPGGTIVVAEPMAGCRAAPGIAPYFAFYLAAMGSGRPRTAAEIAQMLRTAGFTSARLVRDRNPVVTRVMTARKPVNHS